MNVAHARFSLYFALVLCGVGNACGRETEVASEPGAPLPGLTPSELARFEVGKVWFTKVFTPEEGLGPLYTENSCNACHHEPETGGGRSAEPDEHATLYVEPDSCDPLREQGGFVRRHATRLTGLPLNVRPGTPPEANGAGFFYPPILFGRGLVEAIPDETIISMADPEDRDGDGISGRVSRVPDGRIGRFRRKLDRARIIDLAEAGVRYAIGLTTPSFPHELPDMGLPIPPEADPAPEPEIEYTAVEAIADFVRFLAPPQRSIPVEQSDRDVVTRGEVLFEQIGCAACHVPRLRTGPNEIAALDRKTVHLYSDLLLHDMGPALADVCGPTATPSELRTEILWGLQYRYLYMHDGRAYDLREAIELHDGESAASRAAFARLDLRSQLAVLRFLGTL